MTKLFHCRIVPLICWKQKVVAKPMPCWLQPVVLVYCYFSPKEPGALRVFNSMICFVSCPRPKLWLLRVTRNFLKRANTVDRIYLVDRGIIKSRSTSQKGVPKKQPIDRMALFHLTKSHRIGDASAEGWMACVALLFQKNGFMHVVQSNCSV